MKRICSTALLLVSLFVISCRSDEVQIRVEKEHTLRSLLSPHVDPSITLIVGTNDIHDVVGRPPYYLQIPEWNSIFVAAETKDHLFYYHIVNMKSARDTVVDGRGTSFGYWIGATNGISREYILEVSGNLLKIATAGGSRRTTYVVDVDKRRAVATVLEELDSDGKVLKRVLHHLNCVKKGSRIIAYLRNNADQVYQTMTPAPGPGQASQTTTMYFDKMNRLTGTLLPDGTYATNSYTSQGWMSQTSGSRTYPAGYTFDAQGRPRR